MSVRRYLPRLLLAAAFGLLLGSIAGAILDSVQPPLPALRQQPAWVQAFWLNLWTISLSALGAGIGAVCGWVLCKVEAPTLPAATGPLAVAPNPVSIEQDFILQAGRAISQAEDLGQLGALLTLHLENWVKPYFIEVAVFDPVRQQLQPLWVLKNGQRQDPTTWTLHILTQQVAHNAQPLRLQLLDGPDTALQPALRAYLGVPLIFHKDLVGVLAIGTPQLVEAFDANHQQLLSALAPWVATALVQTRTRTQLQLANSQTQTQVAQLEKLNVALSAVAGAWQLEDLIAVVLEQAQQLLPYDAATFWQVLPAPLPNLRWRIAGAQGSAELKERIGLVADAQSPYAALFADLLAEPRLLNLPDITTDPRFSSWPASTARSWLGVPLLNQGIWLGLLALEKNTAGGFAPEALETLQTFAHYVALALAKTQRQAEQLQRLLETEETLRRWRFVQRFALVVHQPQGVLPVLRTTLQTLAEVLGLKHASAAAFDPACVQVVALEHYASKNATKAAAMPVLNLTLALELAARLKAQPTKNWLPNGGSKLFLPLVNDTALVGVVGVQMEPQKTFARVELELSQALAEQAALALTNARRFESQNALLVGGPPAPVLPAATPEALPFLQQLNQLAATLPQCLTPHSVLDATLTTLCAALNVASASAVALDRTSDWITVWAYAPKRPAQSVPSTTLADLVAFMRQQTAPLAVAQAAPPITAEHLAWIGPTVKSALFLPLRSGEDMVGLIGLPLARPLTPGELALTQACTHLAALALDNAQQQAARLAPALPAPPSSSPTAPHAAQPLRRYGRWAAALVLGGVALLACALALFFGPQRLRQLQPLPTRTNQPTVSPTPLVLVVAPTFTLTPPPPPSATASAAPIASPSATASATATSSAAPTASASPSSTASPTTRATLGATPTLNTTPPTLAPGVLAVARVILQPGLTARLRDAANGATIGVVENNMQVEVLSPPTTAADNTPWVRVRLVATGEEGWLAENLLEYLTPKR